MLLNPLTFHGPITLSEALELYRDLQNARIQAGGTFLLNSLKLLKRNGVKTPDHIISLGKIKELQGIEAQKDTLVIKSMTTITDIFESDCLKDNWAVLKEVCRNISTTQIRNMATVGGNLTCRYTWTEMPAVMIGLNAQMHFQGKDGKAETLNAEDFFKNAAKTDKLLIAVSIPRNKKVNISYKRVKKTPNVDIPMLSLLISTVFEKDKFTETRVAVNNCVAFAQRDTKLENFLNQKSCSKTLGQEALENLDTAIYDTRSSDYKKYMFRVCIKNAIQELVEKKASNAK